MRSDAACLLALLAPEDSRTRRSRACCYSYQQSFANNAAWLEQRVAIEEQFEADVQLFLSREEHAIWSQEVRAARKRRILPKALHQFRPDRKRYVHDLTDTLREAGLSNSDREELQRAITNYENALDESLQRYEREWDAAAAEFADALRIWRNTQSAKDERDYQRAQERVYAIRDLILDARMDHLDAITAVLPLDQQADLQVAVDAADFPSLFDFSPVDHLAAALKRDKRLDLDREEAIRQLIETYRPARDAIRNELIALIRWHDFSNDTDLRRELDVRVLRRLGDRLNLAIDTCQSIHALYTQDEIDEMAADIQLLFSPFE